MHRLIQDHLEEVLSGTAWPNGHAIPAHLQSCLECRVETAAMRVQNALLREWKVGEVEPRAGFYARVLERIEAQRPVSIWALFTDSVWGRRLATASLAMAMFMGVYVITSEQSTTEFVATNAAVEMDPLYPAAGFTDDVMTASAFRTTASSNDADVFVNLVTYQGR